MKFIVILFALLGASSAYYNGLHTGDLITDMQCIMKTYSYIILDGLTISGEPVASLVENLKTCDKYNIPCRVAYSPCALPGCSESVTAQVNNLCSAIKSAGSSRQVYVSISTISKWTKAHTTNRATIRVICHALVNNSGCASQIRFRTNKSHWNTAFGIGFHPYYRNPLCYNGNSVHNYADFVAFGGWTKPSEKHYQWSGAVCGIRGVSTISSAAPA